MKIKYKRKNYKNFLLSVPFISIILILLILCISVSYARFSETLTVQGTITGSYTPIIEKTTYTYYFERPSTWESTTIYAHMWSDTTGNQTTWPGTVMTNEGNNIYSVTVNISDGYDWVSFQNGSSSQFSDKTKRVLTGNISLANNDEKIFRGSLLQSTKTMYYEDFYGYGTKYAINVYVWKDSNNNVWPGKPATKCNFASPNNKDIYSFEIGTTYEYAIFTNKKTGSWQSSNLSVANADGCVYGYMQKYIQDNSNYNGDPHWEFPGSFEDYT